MSIFSTETAMSTYFLYMIVLTFVHCGLFEDESDPQAGQHVGLEIKCEETKMRISAKREFFGEIFPIPFLGSCLQLGDDAPSESCRAAASGPAGADAEVVIHAGLQECGTESTVDGDWLIYYNHLVLCPAVLSNARGGLIVKRLTTVIPVECHYKRKQTVSGLPLSPTWQPMTSTVSAFGLLRFSLRTMTGDFTAPRSSSAYQQGEPVFLEASVEAPQHPSLRVYVDHCVASSSPDPLDSPGYKFITNHGCHLDSSVPGSSSAFVPRKRGDRLHFSIHALPFLPASGTQVYIGCHLRVTLGERPPDPRHKACSFHGPTHSWRQADGSRDVCACCNTNDCSAAAAAKAADAHAGEDWVERTTVGPLWTSGLIPPGQHPDHS